MLKNTRFLFVLITRLFPHGRFRVTIKILSVHASAARRTIKHFFSIFFIYLSLTSFGLDKNRVQTSHGRVAERASYLRRVLRNYCYTCKFYCSDTIITRFHLVDGDAEKKISVSVGRFVAVDDLQAPPYVRVRAEEK